MNRLASFYSHLISSPQNLNIYAEDGGHKFLLGSLSGGFQSSPCFQWSEEALERKEQWSPLKMPVQAGVQTFHVPDDFRGLPGLFHDSLPDGWGLSITNTFLNQYNIPSQHITALINLAVLGDRSWGSLCFEVGDQYHLSSLPVDLHSLGHDVHKLVQGHAIDISDELFLASNSLHGARPKIMVDWDGQGQAYLSMGRTRPGVDAWIIKFAAQDEHEQAPMIEQVYMDLARRMKLDVSDSCVLELSGKPAFATKRFDRANGERLFAHSLSGLLHVTHRQSNLDYMHIGEILSRLNAHHDLEEAFRRACFNVALSVRDDHSKNVSLMKKNGQWGLSPAYDLTYMQGPGGYHCMNYADCPERDPTRKFVLQVGINYGLDISCCEQILNESLDISNQFVSTAKNYDISKKWISPIEKRLKQLCKNLRPTTVAASKRSV